MWLTMSPCDKTSQGVLSLSCLFPYFLISGTKLTGAGWDGGLSGAQSDGVTCLHTILNPWVRCRIGVCSVQQEEQRHPKE